MIITNARADPAKPGRALLRSLNCDGRYGLTLLAALGFLGLLAAGGPQWAAALRYQPAAIRAGEWWRLLTAHWVHLGARHLLLDSTGLLLLWVLYARELRPLTWLLVLVGATAVIDAGLWWGEPQLQWYVGISALLHAAWAAGAATAAMRRERAGWVMLALLAIKLAVEQHTGSSLVTEAFPVVSAAHRYGALGGLLAVGLMAPWRKPL
jgi:rhomboid family GlyGly-CTERM serine protease